MPAAAAAAAGLGFLAPASVLVTFLVPFVLVMETWN